mmetsp:Transcript_9648/g.23751  ORF Transcript_9648/g.23751 Transcript_9648/m.23751 type:complete len:430 (-) Transcript_9648:721-2010(-)
MKHFSSSSSTSSNIHTDVLTRSTHLRDLSAKKVRQIRNARSKLSLVHGELEKQFLVARKIQDEMKTRMHRMEKFEKEFLDGEEVPHAKELESIFTVLKERKLEPELVGQEGRTLFDFVDAQSVFALQQQAATEIQNLKRSLRVNSQYMTSVNNRLAELSRLRQAIKLPDVEPEALEKKIEEQKGFVSVIEYHAKELSHSTDMESSDASQQHKEDVKASIRHCESLVASVAQKIESTAGAFAEAYERALKFFTALEHNVPQLRSFMQEFETHTSHFDNCASNVYAMIQELKNLAAWYRQFNVAYGEMLKEIHRRQIQMRDHQRMVSHFQEQLDGMASEESKRREQFSKSYGRFLPPGLCPSLFEPVTSCRILPPSITTDLPRTLRFDSSKIDSSNVIEVQGKVNPDSVPVPVDELNKQILDEKHSPAKRI